jgi:hypothetical protein
LRTFTFEMFKIVGSHVPPSPLMASPLKWNVEAIVREGPGQRNSHTKSP